LSWEGLLLFSLENLKSGFPSTKQTTWLSNWQNFMLPRQKSYSNMIQSKFKTTSSCDKYKKKQVHAASHHIYVS